MVYLCEYMPTYVIEISTEICCLDSGILWTPIVDDANPALNLFSTHDRLHIHWCCLVVLRNHWLVLTRNKEHGKERLATCSNSCIASTIFHWRTESKYCQSIAQGVSPKNREKGWCNNRVDNWVSPKPCAPLLMITMMMRGRCGVSTWVKSMTWLLRDEVGVSTGDWLELRWCTLFQNIHSMHACMHSAWEAVRLPCAEEWGARPLCVTSKHSTHDFIAN